MPSTQIILTENVPGLGAEADVIKVRRGYARNFLLPNGKACEVTPRTMRQLDALKAKRAEREARELNEAEEFARRIGKLKVTFILQTGETGKAFGSITANDLAERLQQELGRESRSSSPRPRASDQDDRRTRSADEVVPRRDRKIQV